MFGHERELLIAELCGHSFLRGFVSHSPKYEAPNEREAGDVVLWVRRHVIVLEVVARESTEGSDTKQFVKRIGEKRDQLNGDFSAFTDKDIEIDMINVEGKQVPFDKSDLADIIQFAGIVIVDCSEALRPLHTETLAKTLGTKFPMAIMTKTAFSRILAEIDTVPDLWFYLRDRHEFLREIYVSTSSLFRTLSPDVELGLLSFYRLHANSFPIEKFDSLAIDTYRPLFHTSLSASIIRRNKENQKSLIIDRLIDKLWDIEPWNPDRILHIWELASMTRRQRATLLTDRLLKAFEDLEGGRNERRFAFFHAETECWLVFYFRFGGSLREFYRETVRMTKFKLYQIMREKGFEYSVFGYGFYKSEIWTGTSLDNICLHIEDASQCPEISEADYQDSTRYFGAHQTHRVVEFPDV